MKGLVCALMLALGRFVSAQDTDPASAEEQVDVLEAGVEGVTKPRVIWRDPPNYPFKAARAKVGGNVILQALIREDGSVADPELLRCRAARAGKPPDKKSMRFCEQLTAAAKDAVRRWRYEPATLNGEPVAVYFTIVVEFTPD